MREIVLDTETTGLDPNQGHRIVEIGCVELAHHLPTGRTFHTYVNPERDMPAEAFEVHGLGTEFLAQHPVFEEVADTLVEFLADDKLVIHNAAFDIRFLNAELVRLHKSTIGMDRAIDTLGVAQTRFPGQSNSLDALCRRFGVDSSARTKHGALLDCELLAEVYLHLVGGRQPDLGLTRGWKGRERSTIERRSRPARPHAPTTEELAAHEAFLSRIKDPIWHA